MLHHINDVYDNDDDNNEDHENWKNYCKSKERLILIDEKWEISLVSEGVRKARPKFAWLILSHYYIILFFPPFYTTPTHFFFSYFALPFLFSTLLLSIFVSSLHFSHWSNIIIEVSGGNTTKNILILFLQSTANALFLFIVFFIYFFIFILLARFLICPEIVSFFLLISYQWQNFNLSIFFFSSFFQVQNLRFKKLFLTLRCFCLKKKALFLDYMFIFVLGL